MHAGEQTLHIGAPESTAAAEGPAAERAEVCMAALAVFARQMQMFGEQINAVLEVFNS